MPSPFAIAACVFEITTENGLVPTEAHLLPHGPFRSNDGRPREVVAWQLDQAIAERVIARMNLRKTDTVIDYEHQSLHKESNGRPAPAAGWFHSMEWRETGLYATNIRWVDDAADAIYAKKYRYISAVFVYDSATGEVLEITSVALTNTPALDGLEALADLARKFIEPTNNNGGAGMATGNNDEKVTVTALTAERDGLNEKVVALTSERNALETNVAALSTELDALKSQLAAKEEEEKKAALVKEEEERQSLLQAALTDGRIAPAQREWAEKQSLASLNEYLGAASSIAMLNRQATGRATAIQELSPEDLAVCSRMGLSTEEFLAAKTK